jgi:hypothetical protein
MGWSCTFILLFSTSQEAEAEIAGASPPWLYLLFSVVPMGAQYAFFRRINE